MSLITKNKIIIKGASENNLKNLDVAIPKDKLIVFTGVSGSGKSSLAFNTIYEEGRRRYVESLSSYARQFLGNSKKPLVDSIEGLSPSISIEQKTTHNNPRSTVGTVTEVYDYLRLLYAKIGKAYCPKHKILISAQKINDIIDSIYQNKEGTKLIVFSPVVFNEKGTHKNLFQKLYQDGFLRVKVNDAIYSLDEEINLNKNQKHNISIVIDRIVLKKEDRSRIVEAIEIAFDYSKGLVEIENLDKKTMDLYSKYLSCPEGDFNMPILEPKLFSFNSPFGMCDDCKGLGIKLTVDKNKLFKEPKKSIIQGGIVYFQNIVNTRNIDWQEFEHLMDYYDISIDKPIEEMSEEDLKIIMHGSNEPIEYEIISNSGSRFVKYRLIEGIASKIERRFLNSTSEMARKWYKNTFMSDIKCNTCNGARLNKYALSIKVNNKNIDEFCKSSIEDAYNQIISMNLNENEKEISQIIFNELLNRLEFLNNVGLEYLSLDRKAETLSGGESQRIRLATQIGSNLTGVLYVLDEPSIGLHQRDNNKLINTLKHMVDIGNTLIVVEHDESTIRSADYIIDIGPKAGDNGGEIVVAGNLEKILKNQKSLTVDYLTKRKEIKVPKSRRGGNGKTLTILEAEENNLQKLNVKIPLGKLVSITGVSGSGKTSLINEVLAKKVQQQISNPFIVPGKCKDIKGINNIDKLIKISQSPIGRTPRSNPATYTSVFDDIRDVFANTPIAKSRGYLKGRFSFNVPGGRCDKCRGDGTIKIEMHFLPDVYIECDHCLGKRYNLETLEVKYRTKNISDILNMKVEEALNFFAVNQKISVKLKTLMDVGLGYIALGQSATTLSGGEAQRVKLATFLLKKPTGKTLYILDEPTTGLHQHDISKLINVLNRIVDGGDSILVIEHNLDIIKVSDHIIDLGPGGGIKGGKLIASGTPEQIAQNKNSFTAQYVKKYL